MKNQMPFAKNSIQFVRCVAIAAALLAAYAAPTRAQDTMVTGAKPAKTTELHYLTAGKPDAATLLAPQPLAGSPEQAADMAETIAVHQKYAINDQIVAKVEPKLTIFEFTPAIGSFFQPGKFPKTEEFLKNVREDTEAVEDKGKDYFKRPRPYTVNPELARGATDLEKSFSYPSGHSTRGTVFALVLAELFPDKTEAILAEGREIGWHRVEIARHYPTDIYAGRVLAQAIVRELKTSEKFKEALAESQKEIATVLAAEKQKAEPATAAAH
jgi:acid phosphatase (class A)